MKKFSVLLIIIPLIVVNISGSFVTYKEDKSKSSNFFDKNTLYVGGGGPNNYTYIQDAINNASDGDTVFVYVRTYPFFENIIIDKSIDLIGQDKDCIIIDGSKNDNVISILSDSVKVEGFTIQNAKDDFFSAGIKISNSNSITIRENIIQKNDGFGVWIDNSISSEIKIFENSITKNSLGLYIDGSTDINISKNQIINNKDGIYVLHSSNIRFFENMVHNDGLGFHISSSSDSTISKNTIFDNSNGIYSFDSSNIIISENIVDKNRWYGIWFRDSLNSEVLKNTISNNIDIGVFFDNSTSNKIENNNIIDNDDGVYLERSSKNFIQNNNFKNYKFNAYFIASKISQCLNRWKNNFWERERFLPKLILGRIKLENLSFSWINFDLYPAKQSFDFLNTFKLKYDKSILFVGGIGPGNYSTIQGAIDHSSENDTIYVYNGTYFEEIIIDKPIKLVGENKEITFLQGNGTRDIVLINSDFVTIQNFSIQNGHFGIFINNSSNIFISDNNIENCLHGISIKNECSKINILKNFFDYNQYGIRIYFSSQISVNFNTFNSYKLNAFFIGSSIIHCRHNWNENYWINSNFLSYLIFGKIRIGNFSLFWFNLDWKPLEEPYFNT